eukprot:2778657-Prymnesium_polylepis.2
MNEAHEHDSCARRGVVEAPRTVAGRDDVEYRCALRVLELSGVLAGLDGLQHARHCGDAAPRELAGELSGGESSLGARGRRSTAHCAESTRLACSVPGSCSRSSGRGAPRPVVPGVLRTPDGVVNVRPKAMRGPRKAAGLLKLLNAHRPRRRPATPGRWLKKSKSQQKV